MYGDISATFLVFKKSSRLLDSNDFITALSGSYVCSTTYPFSLYLPERQETLYCRCDKGIACEMGLTANCAARGNILMFSRDTAN
ncbi:hypothetical protein ANAPRD1_00546 [Anaplasma phagocytophilum]|nr:hypothetical protein ANAPH1_00410 [Anaplasma phagocytophilum]SCV64048.1 hypothetical protein ANAPRD1_00546 [Anaplasma phagocytophilum]SCV64850.1 hypothetical protein ANAPH2_01089 [Anaplasma phagocytophilum]